MGWGEKATAIDQFASPFGLRFGLRQSGRALGAWLFITRPPTPITDIEISLKFAVASKLSVAVIRKRPYGEGANSRLTLTTIGPL